MKRRLERVLPGVVSADNEESEKQRRVEEEAAEDQPQMYEMLGEEYDADPLTDAAGAAEHDDDAYEIPEGALGNPDLVQAYQVIHELPDIDYACYVMWKVVLYNYHDINGPPVPDATGKCAPDIQHIMSVASQHGRLAFVWSAEAYITKSKIAKAAIELVLGLFIGSSRFYKTNHKMCDIVLPADSVTATSSTTAGETPKRMLMRVQDTDDEGGTTLRKFNVRDSAWAVYSAYWKIHHAADDYIERGNAKGKALDQHELVGMWSRVFTEEAAFREAAALKTALLVLLDTMLVKV